MNPRPGIVVVDDDENDLRMIGGALAGADRPAAVRFLHDGAEALDYFFGRGAFAAPPSPLPGLLLLDLHMPRVNGWEVLRQVKADETLRTVPVVIFSSSARDADVRQSYALGANGYVVKPIDYELFRQAIRAIEGYWLNCNHVVPQPGTRTAAGPVLARAPRRPPRRARVKSHPA